MPTPPAAVAHYKAMQQLQADAVAATLAHWAAVRQARIVDTWIDQTLSLTPIIASYQYRAALAGGTYGAMTLAQQAVYVAPTEFVDPMALAGYASDGRPLDTLLQTAAWSAVARIGAGMAPRTSLAAGAKTLATLAATIIADAGRQAGGIDIVARPTVGYVRMLNPPSCARCVVLAGKWFGWNAGFLRHPKCFPAGTIVSGPELDAASRRWYEGELVTLTTASGQELSLTANHPVLTGRGWVPANLVKEGDEVFRSTRPEGASALIVPDHDQVPALVEDVWSAFSVNGLDAMPTAPEDFHGDGQHGEVHIAYSDRALRNRVDTSLDQHVHEQAFPGGIASALGFNPQRATQFVNRGSLSHPGGLIRGHNLGLALAGSHGFISHDSSFTHAAALNARSLNALPDRTARHAVLTGERELAGTAFVGGNDGVDRKGDARTHWDAPTLSDQLEQSAGYTRVGLDLLKRLAGQVEPDRVVFSRSVNFSGHVYSPSSSEGWLSANSLIVSNCDCVHVASTVKSRQGALDEGLIVDQYEYFKSLDEAEQDRIFTGKGAQAIRDGADINQVVNSRRGMTRNGNFTTEGTTQRGWASKNLNPGQRRMTPELIYAMSRSREETLQLLKQHGYLLPRGQVPNAPTAGFGQMGAGGQRRAASTAVLEARRTGIRDPRNRYTMTASERRLYDALTGYETALSGISPYTSPGFGNTPDPYGLGLNRVGATTRPVTPRELATAERHYRRMLATNGQKFT